MLKIRARLAYPSCGSPKHKCWRKYFPSNIEEPCMAIKLRKAICCEERRKHQLKRQPPGIQLSTRTLRMRDALNYHLEKDSNEVAQEFVVLLLSFQQV